MLVRRWVGQTTTRLNQRCILRGVCDGSCQRLPGTVALCVLGWMTMTPAAGQPTSLERGRYLVETVAFCGVCHNSRDPNGQMIPGMELAGGRVMPMNEMRTVLSNIPPGDIRAVAPNITSRSRNRDWPAGPTCRLPRRSARGPRPNGSIIGPPMPIALYPWPLRWRFDGNLSPTSALSHRIHNACHTTHRPTHSPIEPYGAADSIRCLTHLTTL